MVRCCPSHFSSAKRQRHFAQNKHTLPLFISASHQTLQGFVRIINRSERDGEVTIHAIDDTGERFGPVTLSLKAKATQHFNSDTLRDGDPDKGLSGSIANGEGNWRLEIETDLDIEPLAYSRPKGEGFITSTHDVADGTSMRWHAVIFNPGSNTDQQSWLRVVNTSGIDTEVTVEGLDDEGSAGAGVVSFDLAGDAVRMLSAQELEQGSADSTFDGRLGDGAGKWQLFVSCRASGSGDESAAWPEREPDEPVDGDARCHPPGRTGWRRALGRQRRRHHQSRRQQPSRRVATVFTARPATTRSSTPTAARMESSCSGTPIWTQG